MSQRDVTPNLSEFEAAAFNVDRQHYMNGNCLFITLEDDLFSTYASENQVKMTSIGKADKAGQYDNSIAGALSRIILGLRFA